MAKPRKNGPPPQSRARAATVWYNWCLMCLRQSIKDFDVAPEDLIPVKIECSFIYVSISCDRCGDNCLLSLEGVSGDAWDLTDLIEWVEDIFWEGIGNGADWPHWDDDLLRDLRVIAKDLIQDFEVMHTQHRSAHCKGTPSKGKEGVFDVVSFPSFGPEVIR